MLEHSIISIMKFWRGNFFVRFEKKVMVTQNVH
jgi:hypothetical protein